VKLLLDTHLLIWIGFEPHRLSPLARGFIDDPSHLLHFSAAGLWEIAIKCLAKRPDFTADPTLARYPGPVRLV
jgi:PIN domain nuclease of toxin-antitoxin system